GRVDDPVRDLNFGQHVFFPGQQSFVFGFGLLHRGVHKHFQFIELVDPDDAAGVFACRTGFASVAGGVPGKPDGAVGEVQNFVGVVPGQGDLGGAHQIQVVFFDAVNFVIVLNVKAGAAHNFGAHQGRRNDRVEPGLPG